MKKRYSILIITACVVIVALILSSGLFGRFLLTRKVIQSDHAIPHQIEFRFGVNLPEHSHHLYYASHRGLFTDHFAAFTLQNKEECEAVLAEMNYPLEKFKESDTLPQRLIDNGPESWPEKFDDKNWQLTKEERFLIAGPKEQVIYVPEKCRIYLIHWAE